LTKNKLGDFTLLKLNKKFQVVVRQKRINGKTITERFVVVNQHKDVVEVLTEDSIIVNGKQLPALKVGNALTLPKNFVVKKSLADKIEISFQKYIITAVFDKRSHNIHLKVQYPKNKGLRGACIDNRRVPRSKGLFKTEYNPIFPAEKSAPFTAQEKQIAMKKCQDAKVNARHLIKCVDELLHFHKTRYIVKKVVKTVKRVFRKPGSPLRSWRKIGRKVARKFGRKFGRKHGRKHANKVAKLIRKQARRW
jgi:hypothetical protein